MVKICLLILHFGVGACELAQTYLVDYKMALIEII